MVITVHIDKWDVTKILIDNGSQAEILFLLAYEKNGLWLKVAQRANDAPLRLRWDKN
jgi:hypothetical protein